jgi:cysteine desulfurase/selenocysteine lyase
MKPLISKDAFIGLENCAWLYNGAETPPLKVAVQAVNDYLQARSTGPKGREHNTVIETSCRNNIAQLLHGRPEHIAFMSNSSEAISIIANSLDVEAGDNVVINTLEFPSGVLPWLMLAEKGVEIRKVEHRDWKVSAEDILHHVDDRTRLVMASHVSYISGAKLDYRKLYRELKKTNALLLLDVTQSLGATPVHMYDADFVVCSSYKWLLSLHGLGILAVNPERVQGLLPKSAGWRSVKDMFALDRFDRFQFIEDARMFELGFPSYPTIYALNASTQLLLEIGIEKIEPHIAALGQRLIEQLQQLHYTVMTPTPSDERAGNISFRCNHAVEVAEHLLHNNVYVWGGDGRVRASIHLFNDESDIHKLISLLPQATSE